MRAYLQHKLNVLHVYARLSPLLGRSLARQVAARWERTGLYGLLYARSIWGRGARRSAAT